MVSLNIVHGCRRYNPFTSKYKLLKRMAKLGLLFRYKVDNTGGRRGGRRGYENDHDTRDDRKPRDVKKLTRKDNKK